MPRLDMADDDEAVGLAPVLSAVLKGGTLPPGTAGHLCLWLPSVTDLR